MFALIRDYFSRELREMVRILKADQLVALAFVALGAYLGYFVTSKLDAQKVDTTQADNQTLRDQVSDLRGKLQSTEGELQSARSESTAHADSLKAAQNQVAELKEQLAQARDQLAQAREQFAQAKKAADAPKPKSTATAQVDPPYKVLGNGSVITRDAVYCPAGYMVMNHVSGSGSVVAGISVGCGTHVCIVDADFHNVLGPLYKFDECPKP